MSDWWTYRPSDFLLFSPRVYARLIESHNAAMAPLQFAGFLFGLAALVAAWRGRAGEIRLAMIALGLVWAWVGWSFLAERYAAINWAASYGAVGFALEAAALALAGATLRAGPHVPALRRATGVGMTAAAVLAYPLLAPLSGRPLVAAEAFGIMPEPTAIATLGLLLATSPRRRPALALGVLPLAWCLYAGMTLWTLGRPAAAAPLAAAALFLVALAIAGSRAPQEAEARLRSR